MPHLGHRHHRSLHGLGQIEQTLQFLRQPAARLVQFKCFSRPSFAAPEATRRIVESFGGQAPQIRIVEWLNRQAIEIESLTPPAQGASHVFTRIARVLHPARIYVPTLNGRTEAHSDLQGREMFAELAQILAATDSAVRHLANATYYVADESTSLNLNQIRPDVFDPSTPPAASKALVRGTAVAGGSLAVDMIAGARN